MAFCSACGTQMADNAAFCPQCGKAAGQADANGTSSPQPPAPIGSYGTTGAPATPMAENVAGMLAYFTICPALIFLQIVLSFFSYIIPVLMFGVYGLLGLAELALWILLVVKAYQHEMFKLPIVGDLAEKQAGA